MTAQGLSMARAVVPERSGLMEQSALL